MEANRDKVLAWIGLSEGGYVNNPHDNGGATNRGITWRTYNAWRKKQGRPPKDIRSITKEEADEIIYEEYLRPVRFADLPSGVDYSVADFAVNSGVSRAAKELQLALGYSGRDVDGVIGVRTLETLRGHHPLAVIETYNGRRMAFLERLADWRHFGGGWTKRVEGKVPGTQTTDIGVRDRSALMAKGVSNIPAPVETSVPKGVEDALTDISPVTWGDVWTLLVERIRTVFGGK